MGGEEGAVWNVTVLYLYWCLGSIAMIVTSMTIYTQYWYTFLYVAYHNR